MSVTFKKNIQYYKFCMYGFLKNLRFFEPFLYLFFLEKGLSFLQIGVLITTREISRNLLEIPTGILADAFGRRRTLVLSFISYIISFIVFFAGNSYLAFTLAMLLFSFGDAFRTGTHKSLIFEYLSLHKLRDQKVHYYGHTRSWSQMGSALSSILAAFLVLYTGSFRYIFLFSIIPYVLDLILVLTYPKELEGFQKSLDGKSYLNNLKAVFGEIFLTFRKGIYLKPFVNISLFSGYFRAIKDYIQPLLFSLILFYPHDTILPKENISALVIGFSYAGIYLLSSFASRKSGFIADRSGNLAVVLNGSLLIGLLFGVLSGVLYSDSFSLLSIISLILFVGIFMIQNIRKPIGVSYIASLTNNNILATSLSVESQSTGIFAAILAPLIGFLADKFGVSWGLVVVSVMLLLVWPIVRLKKNFDGMEIK